MILVNEVADTKRKRFVASGVQTTDVLRRLADVMGVDSDHEMARTLGTARTTVTGWRGRGVIPYAVCVDIAQKHDVSLDWLVLGKRTTDHEKDQQACDVSVLARAIAASRPSLRTGNGLTNCQQEADLLVAVYELLLHDADDGKVQRLVAASRKGRLIPTPPK